MKCVPKYLKSSFIIFLGVMGLSQPSGADGPSLSKLCVVDETLSNSDINIVSEDNQGRQRTGFDEREAGNPRKNIFDAMIRALKKNPAEAPSMSVKLGDCLEMRLEISGHRFSSEAEGFDNLIAELTDSPLNEEQRLSDFQTFHSSALSFNEFVGKKDSMNTLEKLEKRGFDVEVTQPRYNTSLKDALLKLVLEKRGRPFIVKCNDPQTVEGPIRLEQTVTVKIARSDIFVGSLRLVYTANAKATFTCIVGGPNCCNTTEIVDEASRREREGAPCVDDMVINLFKKAIQPFNEFKDKYNEYPICRDTGKTMSDLPAMTFVNTREEANAFIQAKKAELAQEFCTKPCARGQCKPFTEAAIIEIPQRAGGGDDIDVLRKREDIDRGAGLLGYNDTTAARFMADQRNRAERQGNSRNGNILASVVDFECICCGVSAAVVTPPSPGPQDQPVEEGGTLLGPASTEEEGVEAPPTEGDIGTGGGAGGAGSAPAEEGAAITPSPGVERTCNNFQLEGAIALRAGERVEFKIKANFFPNENEMFSQFVGFSVLDSAGKSIGFFGRQIHAGVQSNFGSTATGDRSQEVTSSLSPDGTEATISIPGGAVPPGAIATVQSGCMQTSAGPFQDKSTLHVDIPIQ